MKRCSDKCDMWKSVCGCAHISHNSLFSIITPANILCRLLWSQKSAPSLLNLINVTLSFIIEVSRINKVLFVAKLTFKA